MGKLLAFPNYTVTSGGFSLLGVVVSLSLLTIGIVASASVTARTEHAIGISRDRLVAINLAREGLELVQAQRDSNWGQQRVDVLAQKADPTVQITFWADQLCDPADPADTRLTVEYDPGGGGLLFDPISGGTSGQLYADINGWYTHVVGANATPFSRVITIACGASTVRYLTPDERFIEITSRVQWNSRGLDRDVELKIRLYDWGSPL